MLNYNGVYLVQSCIRGTFGNRDQERNSVLRYLRSGSEMHLFAKLFMLLIFYYLATSVAATTACIVVRIGHKVT